jgi:hypothetical protein
MLVGLVFIGVGGSQVMSQHKKIQTFVPVQATVLSKSIATHVSRSSKGRRSVTYSPVVNYIYKVGRRNYNNNTVLPISLSSSHGWAQEIIDKYSINSTYTAYYNPEYPPESFLVKKYIFFPYIFILFPMIFFCLGLYFLVAGGNPDTKPRPPSTTRSSLYKLIPARSIVKRIQASSTIAGVWTIGCGAALLHFYTYAKAPYGTTATISTLVAVIITATMLSIAIGNITLQSNIKEPSLFVKTPHFKPGDTIELTIRQNLKKPLLVESARVGLISERIDRKRSGSKTRISKSINFAEWTTLTENYPANPSLPLSYTPDLTIPTDKPPTTPPKEKSYPRYQWRIEYHLTLAKSPDLKTKFPITITYAPTPFAPPQET